jgi:hypothetical protein
MLHDLYLLSCYFEPVEAVLYEDEVTARYGAEAVRTALRDGLIELFRAPCKSNVKGRYFCRLTDKALSAGFAREGF